MDAVPIFVHASDQSWDWERVKREQGEMERPESHPVIRYFSHETRYDLHAKLPLNGDLVSAADYLDEEKAVQFRMRRMESSEFARVQVAVERADRNGDELYEAWDLAYQLVRPKVEAPEGMPQRFDEVGPMCGPWMVWAVGEAAYWASIPLRADEKKP